MYLRRKYEWERFEKLVGIICNPFYTYIVNGFVYYVGDSGCYERINSRAIGYESIEDIVQMGEEEGQEVVVIFIGKHHTQRSLEYLECIKNLRKREE